MYRASVAGWSVSVLVGAGLVACGGEVVSGEEPPGAGDPDATIAPDVGSGSDGAPSMDGHGYPDAVSPDASTSDASHPGVSDACAGPKVVDALGTIDPPEALLELRLACSPGAKVVFKGQLVYPTGEEVWDTFYGSLEKSGKDGEYRLRASELGESHASDADSAAGWFAIVWDSGKTFAVGRNVIIESSELHVGAMAPALVPVEVLGSTFGYE